MTSSFLGNMNEELFLEAKESFIAGNYKLAEPMLNQLLLKNLQNPEVHQMLATIYYDKGQFNKAIKTFRRALEIDPNYTDASVGLSIILNDLGRYEEGQKVFETAQAELKKKSGKQDPYIEERIATKHEELGDLYFQTQRYPDSLEQFLKAMQFSNRKAELKMRIADVYVHLNDSNKAINELKGLIREYPQFNQARIKLGLIYYNLNKIAEATEQWENILMRDSQHSEARRYLKMAQAAGITSLEL
jgi:tetratricopeptide (TPR) repeat protein